MDFYDMNDFIPHYDISVEELSEDINETLKVWKTLTYINTKVFYNGYEFNAGTLACMALNTIGCFEKLSKLYDEATEMSEYSICVRYNAEEAVDKEITELLDYATDTLLNYWKSEPFSYISVEKLESICYYVRSESEIKTEGSDKVRFIDRLFSLVQNAYDIVKGIYDLYSSVERFNDSLNILGLNSSKANLAKVFSIVYRDYYSALYNSGNVVNTSVKYTTGEFIGKQYIYSCFSQMLFADFFEGLSVGHSIRKCEVCGKYFLAVNRLEKRYCSEDCAAKAEAEGIKAKSRETSIANIYYRVTDSLNHKKNRNKITEEVCSKAKRIAKDNYIMAKTDSKYARGEYITEMDADKLIKEAEENVDE